MLTTISQRVSSSGLSVFLQRFILLDSVKWITLLVILLNVKSWPFVWHLRVFRPVVRVVLRDFIHVLRVRLSLTQARKEELEDQWIDKVCLVGTSPFDFINVYRTRATIDECDFNSHLSNSSYGKILDASRFECVLALFPLFFRSGGNMALGASNFHFIKEISTGQQFEIRSSIGGWDNKWLYLVSRFVSKSSSPSSKGTTQAKKTPVTEPDGSLVYAVAVIHLCFKAGRITVPPGLVLASNGFCALPSASIPPSDSEATSNSQPLVESSHRISPPNPPLPHWEIVKKIASLKYGGSLKTYFTFVREGWKNVPEDECWWDIALSGEVEARRSAAMVDLSGLQRGLESARSPPLS